MIIHRSESRGLADHGWLKSCHTFSFGDYYNPERMGFGVLRVINDDTVAPGKGFGTHAHRDMEIISIPLVGALRHQDSQGNSTVIKKGEVQIMSAGTGISHSEYNDSSSEEVKFLQIWVMPEKLGIKPRYEQKVFSPQDRQNKFSLVVSPRGLDGSLTINQNAFFNLADLTAGKTIHYQQQSSGNGVYVLILKGEVEVEGQIMGARDGVGINDFQSLKISGISDAEILVMEIPV